MSEHIYYNRGTRFSDYLWKGLGVVFLAVAMLAVGDALVDFTGASLPQMAFLAGSSTAIMYLGRSSRVAGRSRPLVMGLYTWSLTSVTVWLLHVVFAIDVTGIDVGPGLAWVLGSMNLVVLNLPPWWYFVAVGFVGGVIMAIASVVSFPTFAPYRVIVWSFIGAVLAAVAIPQVTDRVPALGGSGTWSWSSLWGMIYAETASSVSIAQEPGITLLVVTLVTWSGLWMAAVVARRAFDGVSGY